MQTYKSVNGQSIYDVCLQTYGTLDYLYKLMQDNGVNGLDEQVLSEQEFVWDDSLVINQQVNAAFLQSRNILATAIPVKPPPPIQLGDFLFGGVVAYLLQPGDPGYLAGVEKGFVASIELSVGAATWQTSMFSPFIITGANNQEIGAGLTNTNIMVAAYAGGVGLIARNYTGGGFTDWFLPTRNELQILLNNRTFIGGMNNSLYWSSSESSTPGSEASQAWAVFVGNGVFTQASKTGNCSVRPCRYFQR